MVEVQCVMCGEVQYTVYRVYFVGENFCEFRISVAIRESFSVNIYFQAIHESFLPRKKPAIR